MPSWRSLIVKHIDNFSFCLDILQEECNVICVDWEAGALIPNYVRAAANTRLVGKQLSMLLEGLNKHLGLPFHNIHVIGFSLGAHVAGFAGAELKNLSRITGKYENKL
jgi:hypothetical protein